jgi:hypothetical protein
MKRLLCVAVGTAFVAVGAIGLTATARAAETPGSGFARFNLVASAPGMQVLPPSAVPAEGDVGQSVAQLQSGPQSYALATIAWPGPLAGNAGTTLGLLAPPGVAVPPQASALNVPVRAEARTGQQPPTTTSSYGGATLTATALDDAARADAAVAGTTGPNAGASTGSTETTATSTVTGPAAAQSVAISRVDHVVLNSGTIKIKSVTSTANALTNGVTSSASGETVINGLEIGGQQATIDQNGIHAGPAGVPVNAIADQIINSSLGQAGITLAISQPSKKIKGGDAQFDAGNLVVGFPGGFIYTFGGASVAVAAVPGTPGSLTLPNVTIPPLPAVESTSPSLAPTATPPHSAPVPGPTLASPSIPEPAPSPAGFPTALAAQAAALPRGLTPAWVILALVGSVLIAAGLGRLPDRTLEKSSNVCTIGDDR